MITPEQIEFMKNNRVQWGMLTAEERSLFNKIENKTEVLQFRRVETEWMGYSNLAFYKDRIFRLRPDWQPEEPEVKIPEKPISYRGDSSSFTEFKNTVSTLIDWAHSVEKRLSQIKGV